MTAAGLTHPTVSVQSSTNLIEWSVLYTTNAASASPVLRLPWAPDAPLGSRFFRLVQP